MPVNGRDNPRCVAGLKRAYGVEEFQLTDNQGNLAIITMQQYPSATGKDLIYARGFPIVRLLQVPKSTTGDDLRHVSGLAHILKLHLNDSQIDDDGLTHLHGLTGLVRLDLTNTKITDTGLANLPDLPNLLTINLEGTKITDEGLQHLTKFRKLDALDLPAQIKGPGLRYLKNLPLLGALSLADDGIIDDAGLVHIYELKQLRSVRIPNVNVTDKGEEELQKAMSGTIVMGPRQRKKRGNDD